MTIRSHRAALERSTLRGIVTAAALLGLIVAPAVAQPVSDQPAALIFFPDVVGEFSTVPDAEFSTRIQLSNTSPSALGTLCIYIDGESGQQTNFDLTLEGSQTINWVASQGLQTGDIRTLVPPVRPAFNGALLCVVLDQSGTPLGVNALIGTATYVQPETGEIAQANAIGLLGNPDEGNGDRALLLGSEYTACPNVWLLNHVADGAIEGAADEVHTRLNILSCTQDFFTGQPVSTTVDFLVINEFEQTFSASTNVTSFDVIELSENSAFSRELLGTDYAVTRITSTGSGILVSAVESRSYEAGYAAVGINLHHDGVRELPDALVLPLFGSF